MTVRFRPAIPIALASALLAAAPSSAARSAPSAPRAVAVTPGPATLTLAWKAPRRIAGGVRAYRVWCAVPGATARTLRTSGRRRSALLIGLLPGRRYACRVRARSAAGWGKASARVAGVPGPLEPVRTVVPTPVPTTVVPMPTPTATATGATATATPTATPTPTATATVTHTATATATTTASPTPTPTPTPTPFGAIANTTPVVAPELSKPTPSLFSNRFDFGMDPFDDPEDRPRLTPGARYILETPDGGGTFPLGEAFAYETLARAEGASLLKAQIEIVYDRPYTPPTDMLVSIAGSKVGVSVMRAHSAPGFSYTSGEAKESLERKLENIRISSQNVSAGDRWVKQILVVVASSDMHADVIREVWATVAPQTKADTVLYLLTTDGADINLYCTGLCEG